MTHRNIKIKYSSGFSTLELLIAMTILIMVLSSIIFVIFSNQSLSVDSETSAEALNKAQAMLEQEQALARKDFKLINPIATTPDDIYQKTISVSNVDFFTKKITSSITWQSEGGRTQHVDLTSLVTNFENAMGGDTCYSTLSGDWTSPRILNTGHTDLATILGDSTGSYPVTNIDAYQNKLYVTVNNSTAVTAGANNPSTSSGTIGAGTINWTIPSNATKTSDNVRATASLTSGQTTHYIKATNFGFTIPTWATITGIKVEVERSIAGTTTTGVKDSEVKIIKSDGSISANNKADLATSWPLVASESYATYNPVDLWGETWSPADINNANFGVAISASATASRTAQIDHVRITITYTRQFYILNTTTPSSPTFISALGSNTITTAMNAVATDGKYAYIATNSSTAQLEIVNLNVTPPALVSTLRIGTSTNVGNSIFYKNGYVYLGLTNTASGPKEFNIIDVHSPSTPTLVGSATIGNTVNEIYVLNNYAYVASPNTNDLMIFNIAVNNLSLAMTPIATFNGTGGLHGKSIYVVGDTAYLGRTFGTNELYILDTSSLPTISTLGTPLDIAGATSSINSLIIRDYLSFWINTAGQFQVWKTGNPTSITRYDTTPLSAFPLSGNNTPLDCEGNNIYGGYTDASNKGYITVITSS